MSLRYAVPPHRSFLSPRLRSSHRDALGHFVLTYNFELIGWFMAILEKKVAHCCSTTGSLSVVVFQSRDTNRGDKFRCCFECRRDSQTGVVLLTLTCSGVTMFIPRVIQFPESVQRVVLAMAEKSLRMPWDILQLKTIGEALAGWGGDARGEAVPRCSRDDEALDPTRNTRRNWTSYFVEEDNSSREEIRPCRFISPPNVTQLTDDDDFESTRKRASVYNENESATIGTTVPTSTKQKKAKKEKTASKKMKLKEIAEVDEFASKKKEE